MNKFILVGGAIVIAIAIAIGAFLLFGQQSPIQIEQGNGAEGEPQEGLPAGEEPTADGNEQTKEFVIIGTPFQFSANELRAAKGDTVRVTFMNAGGTHDWKIDEFNAATSILQTGAQETVEFVANRSGSFEYYCSVGNHRELGMRGTLIIEE